MITYFYYKKSDGTFRTLQKDTGKVKTVNKLPLDCKKFYVMKGYTANKKGLKQYAKDFDRWCNELNNAKIPIDYASYYSHNTAVECTFKRFCKGRYEHHEKITPTESYWMSMCFNGGLVTMERKGTYDCYTYDYSAFYPTMLAGQLKIPVRAGKEYRLESIPEKNRLAGYYRVKISCDDPSAKKMFSFSKYNCYTHQSLSHAIYLKKLRFKTMNIELIQDGQPNAYLYQKEDMEQCKNVFGWHFNYLSSLKKQFPKNKLVKHLMSSLWGHLSKSNVLRLTKQEIDEQNIDMDKYEIVDITLKKNEEMYYTLQLISIPMKYNLRLKSFLTACGRVKIARLINDNYKLIDNIQAVQTDSITFRGIDPKLTSKRNDLTKEHKKCGVIKWKNANKFEVLKLF